MGDGRLVVSPSGILVGVAPDRRTMADAVTVIELAQLGFRFVGHAHEKRELCFQRACGEWIDVVLINTVGGASVAARYDRRHFPPTGDSEPLRTSTLGEIADVVRQVHEWPCD